MPWSTRTIPVTDPSSPHVTPFHPPPQGGEEGELVQELSERGFPHAAFIRSSTRLSASTPATDAAPWEATGHGNEEHRTRRRRRKRGTRQLQRYTSGGHRLVVGCIPYKLKDDEPSKDAIAIDQALEVLVISSQKGQETLFPKVSLLRNRVNIASGTPSRIKKLIDMEALGLSRLSLIVLDIHKDAKGFSLFTLPQVRNEFWDLYRSHFHQRLIQGDLRICFYGPTSVSDFEKTQAKDES